MDLQAAPAQIGCKLRNLREKPFQVLLKVLKEEGGGYVQIAADRLTQSVQDVYDGKTFSLRFAFEEVKALDIRKMDSSRILELAMLHWLVNSKALSLSTQEADNCKDSISTYQGVIEFRNLFRTQHQYTGPATVWHRTKWVENTVLG